MLTIDELKIVIIINCTLKCFDVLSGQLVRAQFLAFKGNYKYSEQHQGSCRMIFITKKGKSKESLHHSIPSKHFAKMLTLSELLTWSTKRQGVVFILLAWIRERSHLFRCTHGQSTCLTNLKHHDRPCWQTTELGRPSGTWYSAF